jgi:hypothetical protein
MNRTPQLLLAASLLALAAGIAALLIALNVLRTLL